METTGGGEVGVDINIIDYDSGAFNVLGDKLNLNLKRVFEAESSAAEPKIYHGNIVSWSNVL